MYTQPGNGFPVRPIRFEPSEEKASVVIVPPLESSESAMADTWITDLTHFLEDGRLPQELPGPALRLAEYLGRIVAAVTGAPPDDPLEVRFRRGPGRRPCPGEIEGYIVPESNAIYWGCLVCGDNGLISNWENTIWDLREADEHTRRSSYT